MFLFLICCTFSRLLKYFYIAANSVDKFCIMAFDVSQSQDGFYSLCVFNAENLSDDQLYEIFGKFGEINRIHRSKNIVFLRYHTKEDAVSCLEAMQNHPKFSVKPAKQKISSQDSQNSSIPKYSDMNRGEQGRKSEDSFGAGNQRKTGVVGGRVNDKLPPIPDLAKIYAPECPLEPNAPKAKIVVIANLPIGFKQKNIYDLCSSDKEGVKPLHVAMKRVNRPPHPEVRYSYVYFKTDEEVSTVVNYLNDLIVNDYTLVVNSVEQLLEEV